jgi:hypothetical protein
MTAANPIARTMPKKKSIKMAALPSDEGVPVLD